MEFMESRHMLHVFVFLNHLHVHVGITGVVFCWRFNCIFLSLVNLLSQANIRLIKAGLKLVGAMCSCGSDVASVLIVSCFPTRFIGKLSHGRNLLLNNSCSLIHVPKMLHVMQVLAPCNVLVLVV